MVGLITRKLYNVTLDADAYHVFICLGASGALAQAFGPIQILLGDVCDVFET